MVVTLEIGPVKETDTYTHHSSKMSAARHQACGKAWESSLTVSLSALSSLGLQSPRMSHTEADLPTSNPAETRSLLRTPFAGAAHDHELLLLQLCCLLVLVLSGFLVSACFPKNYQVVSVNVSSLSISPF